MAVNYVDRQLLGIVAPTSSRALHWSETDYGDVVSWFSLVYALGFLAAGRLLDRIGVKRGLGAAVVTWPLASGRLPAPWVVCSFSAASDACSTPTAVTTRRSSPCAGLHTSLRGCSSSCCHRDWSRSRDAS